MKVVKFQNLQQGKTDLETLVAYDYTVEQFSKMSRSLLNYVGPTLPE